MAQPLASSISFGRYRLVEKLGEGGMAVVYRGVLDGPDRFARSVVVKRIRPAMSNDPDFQRMFAQEARVLALLHHPGIVQITDYGRDDGECFLVMEYVDGHDMNSILYACLTDDIVLPIEVACHVTLELAAAIGYAHALCDTDGSPIGLVHRDISPSNVFVGRHGAVKLLDFGIAKLSSSVASSEVTRSGTLKGKIGYMSPEQADGRELDGRSDLFSLGILFHEMLTRRRLFRSKDDLETLRRIREAEVKPPSSARPQVGPELDAIVVKLLARDPAARFQTGEEVVEALSPLAHRLHADDQATARFVRQLKLAPASQPLAVADTDPMTVPEVKSAPPTPSPPRRPPLVLAAAVVVGVAGMTVLYRSRSAPRAPVASPPVTSPAAKMLDLPVPPSPATSSARLVALTVEAPPGSAVSVDGEPRGAAPMTLRLPARDGIRKVIVQLPTHRTWSGELDASTDQHVRVPASGPRRHAPKEIKDPFAGH
jgi:serine/threonine-protein kinase